MRPFKRVLFSLPFLITPLFASVPHADVNQGAQVVLTSDARKWFNCEGGQDCEDDIKNYALGTISKIERFRVFVKLKEGGKVIIGSYNEAGMEGADLATPEKLQERNEWLKVAKEKEKERQDKIRALSSEIKKLKSSSKWNLEGVSLGMDLSEARKILRKSNFSLADLGDDIWAVNGYKIADQEVQVHLWFNKLGLLYLVKIQGEPQPTQRFQKTVLGQVAEFEAMIEPIFGKPKEEKRPDIYSVSEGEEAAFKEWDNGEIEVKTGVTLQENLYHALAIIKAKKLEDDDD